MASLHPNHHSDSDERPGAQLVALMAFIHTAHKMAGRTFKKIDRPKRADGTSESAEQSLLAIQRAVEFAREIVKDKEWMDEARKDLGEWEMDAAIRRCISDADI